jgi:exosortase
LVSPAQAPAELAAPASRDHLASLRQAVSVPAVATAALFVVLYFKTILDLINQWWNNPDAGHGLLLAPVAVWLAYRRGKAPTAKSSPRLGAAVLVGAVALSFVGTLAGELFTMRASMLVAITGLVVWWRGFGQVWWWWLSFTIAALSIPLPAVLMNTMAIPLQLIASKVGAGLLAWRDVPFRLNGNVIDIPGFRLFVAEACSGLRSLTALLSLGVLIGGLWLQRWPTRVALVALAIPVAVLLNGFRVFLTAFLMYFVDPEFGRGFMHLSEGWLIFVVALGLIALVGMGLRGIERAVIGREGVNG